MLAVLRLKLVRLRLSEGPALASSLRIDSRFAGAARSSAALPPDEVVRSPPASIAVRARGRVHPRWLPLAGWAGSFEMIIIGDDLAGNPS